MTSARPSGSAVVRATILAKLDQFIFSEDVQLGDVTATFAQIAVVGPDASRVVSTVVPAVTDAKLAGLPEHGSIRSEWKGQPAIITCVTDTGVSGYDVYVEHARVDEFKAALTAAGATPLDESTSEALRIESGVPLFGVDMDGETIPLEAGIEARAISFTKGCYVGQEVVIRVLHRGHGRVARKLVGLSIDGERVPTPGAAIRANDRELGEVTSSTWSPALKRPIALAYVHRDFVEPGTNVTVDGEPAQVTALPFVALS